MSVQTQPVPVTAESGSGVAPRVDLGEVTAASPPGAAPPAVHESRSGRRRRRGIMVAIVLASCVVVAAATYAVTFAPDHYAQWRAEPIDGVATAEVGAGVQVLPGKGWLVQPRVTDLVELPLLPPLRNPNVILGANTGLQLVSPDGGLSIELFAGDASAQRDAAWLADVADHEREVRGADAAQLPPVLTETLASGAGLDHADAPGEIRAVVTVGETRVRVLARAMGSPGDTSDADRVGTVNGGATDPITVYRPALSELLESLTAS